MMRKKMIAVLVVPMMLVAFTAMAASIEPEIKILDKKEIVLLADDALIDTYMDAVVEIQASEAFHATSGFSPKDYRTFKELLKFRMLLAMEIHKRNLEIPQLDK